MKTLLSTTAIVLGLSLPTVLPAQTATMETTADTTVQTVSGMSGFLDARGPSDVYASELIGRDVYARRVPADMAGGTTATTGTPAVTDQAAAGQATDDQPVNGVGVDAYAAENSDGTNNLSLMTRAELDTMDNIGQINEIVLSHDGQVRALVIGVGGFLGMGERDVAVTMDQVTIASDADDRSEMFVVVNTGAEMLRTSPAYDRTAMWGDGATATDTMPDNAVMGADRTAFTAPEMTREGYNRVEVTDVSAEMLVGQSVYGVNDDSVGTIDDLIVDASGAITNVVIDFGGFLGMGTSQVSVGFDELTILADEGRTDVRVYVDATKEQVQAQPQYNAMN